jgi:guanine nucleotide-binding protein G(i) subunit alpha
MAADCLTGSGESGKSTIVKQMKIIHQNGYTVEELTLYRNTIFKNVIDCARALIAAMNQLEIHPEHEINRQYCAYLSEYSLADGQRPLDLRVGQAVSSIWQDPCVPRLLEHSTEFYIMDSAP